MIYAELTDGDRLVGTVVKRDRGSSPASPCSVKTQTKVRVTRLARLKAGLNTAAWLDQTIKSRPFFYFTIASEYDPESGIPSVSVATTLMVCVPVVNVAVFS